MAEADRNQLLATTEAARGVKLALIAEVATTYFTYLQYEYALQIAESTYASRKSSYELTRQSYGIGTVSDLDMKQAESALAAAEAAVPQYRRGKQEAMYALSLLMGENPSNLSGTHASLMQQHLPGDIPAGLPSDLLTRRPDIMEAYYQVAASNAQIGVAQAMRFPSIAITGAGGLLSEEFKKLFDSKAWMWSAAGSLTGPIFSFGANKRRVQVAREKNKETILNYEQSYLQAMNDVETALSDVQNYRQQTVALKATIGAVQHSYDLLATALPPGTGKLPERAGRRAYAVRRTNELCRDAGRLSGQLCDTIQSARGRLDHPRRVVTGRAGPEFRVIEPG